MHHKYYYYRQLLSQFEALIGKTLSRLGIRPSHIHYDDYFQELRIKLVELADRFDGRPLAQDRYRFTAYAGQGLYWHLIDLLRKDQRIQEEAYPQFNEFINQVPSQQPLYQSQSQLNHFLKVAQERLSDEEYRLLWLLADEEITVVEIARLLGVSRKTVYKRRQALQAKLADLKYLLES